MDMFNLKRLFLFYITGKRSRQDGSFMSSFSVILGRSLIYVVAVVVAVAAVAAAVVVVVVVVVCYLLFVICYLLFVTS